MLGRDPLLIKSTKLLTSSKVNLPWIITSLANPWETVAALKQLDAFVPHKFPYLEKLSIIGLKSNQITI